jgi:integrase
MDKFEGRNPFSNMLIKNTKGQLKRRKPFTSEELQVLFMSPVYTGCKGKLPKERLKAGNLILKNSLFWIPLIGLHSGMRLNEICQLYVSDIRYEQDILIFDINDDSDDKTLKNISSRRKIPLHHYLIQAGIYELAKEKEYQGEKRLFPDIPLSCKNTYSSIFSKRFAYLLKTLALKKEGLCFHSLRHTFIDGMRNAGVERAITMAITGHSSGDVHGGYGNGYNLKTLKKNLDKLRFLEVECYSISSL